MTVVIIALAQMEYLALVHIKMVNVNVPSAEGELSIINRFASYNTITSMY